MPIEISHFTRIVMDQLQIVALSFMAVVYILKVRWILKHVAAKERTPPRGDHRTGIQYAYLTLAMPWEMESTRTQPVRYVEFALFHVGVAVAIGATLIMPYWPRLIGNPLMIGLMQAVILLALLSGVSRLIRRVAKPEMRAISSPDDYFSIVLLNVWLLTALFGVTQTSEVWIALYFGLTAFFLMYVPFSKISHYIYWPFIRFYMGRHFGHRAVYPKKAVPHV